MPTGYTAPVQDGITFEQFVLRSARAMGALIMLRDEPMDAPIPDRFEPSDYHSKALKKAEERLAWLIQMPSAEAEREAKKQFEEKQEFTARMIKQSNEILAKYDAMLEQVRAWTPPTPDHEGLKEFMVRQLVESIDFDCDTRYWENEAPVLLSAEAWKQGQIQSEERSVVYHREEYCKEVERTEARNDWLRALRESLTAGQKAAA